MGLESATFCLDQTKESIERKLTRLLAIAISEQLHPFISKLSIEQAIVEEEARRILDTHPALTALLSLRNPFLAGSALIRWGTFTKEVSFEHPPTFHFLSFQVVPEARPYPWRARISSTGFNEPPSEEVVNAANRCAVFATEMSPWLGQFHDNPPGPLKKGNITETALSRICSISPTFRACLVNTGSKYPLRKPAVITCFKQGPRLANNFQPMSKQLSLALTIAANMPEEEPK
jgi:hypothetical protein